MTTLVQFLLLTCLLSFDNILTAVICHTVFIMFTNYCYAFILVLATMNGTWGSALCWICVETHGKEPSLC